MTDAHDEALLGTGLVDAALRGAGLRVTDGRRAVLAALAAHPHSDAESVRRALAADGVVMSVQSAHNILGDLTQAGLVRRIEPAGSAALYERRIADNHHHVVCRSCGAVADIDCVHGEAPCLTPSDDAGFAIEAAEIVFWGVCSACRAQTSADAAAPAVTSTE